MTTTENAIAALKADLEGLNVQITEQKARHKAERDEFRLQRAPLARAIRALAGGGKPMTAEAKAAIKAGLEKARAAKLAGNTAAASVAIQPVAVKLASAAVAVAKKDLASDKGPQRVS
ncbi:MAG: hypothetical protein ABI142_13215 [Bryocella sp.]